MIGNGWLGVVKERIGKKEGTSTSRKEKRKTELRQKETTRQK